MKVFFFCHFVYMPFWEKDIFLKLIRFPLRLHQLILMTQKYCYHFWYIISMQCVTQSGFYNKKWHLKKINESQGLVQGQCQYERFVFFFIFFIVFFGESGYTRLKVFFLFLWREWVYGEICESLNYIFYLM